MTSHPKTQALAILLNARQKWDEKVAAAIAELFSDYEEEKKADLYAMLVEGIKPDMTYAQMVAVVDSRLRANDLRYPEPIHG